MKNQKQQATENSKPKRKHQLQSKILEFKTDILSGDVITCLHNNYEI